MGLIDQIAEKASDKIAEHVKGNPPNQVDAQRAAGKSVIQAPQGPITPTQTADPSAKAIPILGLKEGADIVPGTGAANIETTPMPNTNPAARVMGLGETDVAPGMNYSPAPGGPQPEPTPAPVDVPKVATPAPASMPVVGNTEIGPAIPGATNMGGSLVTGDKATNPVKDAAKQPGFWDNVVNVASKTGKSILELLGDFAAGYAGQTSPTEQRLQREHELRMQGNSAQIQKDLLSMNQGFNEQQNQLQRDHDTALANAKNDLERQQIEQNFQIQKQSLQNQRLMMQQNYEIAQLNRQWQIAGQQGQTGGAGSFYKFGGE